MRVLTLAGAALAAMTGMAAAAVRSGCVAVTDAANTSLGWISRTPNKYGEYVVTADPAARLRVSYDDASSPFSLQVLDAAAASTSWLGAIGGFSSTSADLGAGSSNYAYLGGSALTAPGATPDTLDNTLTDSTGIPSPTESSIWSQPGTASPLVAGWVNADGSVPSTQILLSNGLLLLTGDASAFTAQYGPATLASLTLAPFGPATPPQPVPAPASLAFLGAGLLSLLVTRRRT